MIHDLELALKNSLETAGSDRGRKFVTDTYSGQLDEDLLKELAQKAPAVYVTFSGMNRIKARRTGHHTFLATFVLIVAGRSVNDEHARGGGRGGRIVGAFELLDIAFFATCDLKHELIERPFRPERVTNLFNAKVGREYLAAYGLAVSCEFTVSADWGLAALDDFEAIDHTATIGGEGTPAMQTTIPQTEDEEA